MGITRPMKNVIARSPRNVRNTERATAISACAAPAARRPAAADRRATPMRAGGALAPRDKQQPSRAQGCDQRDRELKNHGEPGAAVTWDHVTADSATISLGAYKIFCFH